MFVIFVMFFKIKRKNEDAEVEEDENLHPLLIVGVEGIWGVRSAFILFLILFRLLGHATSLGNVVVWFAPSWYIK